MTTIESLAIRVPKTSENSVITYTFGKNENLVFFPDLVSKEAYNNGDTDLNAFRAKILVELPIYNEMVSEIKICVEKNYEELTSYRFLFECT